MDPITLLVIALCVLVFGLVSRRIEASLLTAPMLFTAVGLLAGPSGAGIISLDLNGAATHVIIELTLVLVLFTDASRIRLNELRRGFRLPLRLLVIGLPLTIALGLLVARPLFPELTWMELGLLAAILAPTDAALGQVVVSSPRVPVRIRQALNVESGLNDGIAVPVVSVLLAAAIALGGDSTIETSHGSDSGFAFAVAQIGLGPIAGLLVAWPAGWLVQRAADARSSSRTFEHLSGVAITIGAFATAELIGGNGFIAAFTAGLVIGNTTTTVCEKLQEFAEEEGQLLTLIAFLVFGAVMLPPAFESLDAATAVYIGLSLTVIRMVPVMLALLGSGLRMQSTAFIGWFGPRGLATILFALLVAEAEGIINHELIFHIGSLTVAASILAHGLSAARLAALFGKWAEHRRALEPEGAECQPAPDLPVRIRLSDQCLAAESER